MAGTESLTTSLIRAVSLRRAQATTARIRWHSFTDQKRHPHGVNGTTGVVTPSAAATSQPGEARWLEGEGL